MGSVGSSSRRTLFVGVDNRAGGRLYSGKPERKELPMSLVVIPSDWVPGVGTIPATTVEISETGQVTWHGRVIGYVWKADHRMVDEWHGDSQRSPVRPSFRADTRREVVRRLIGNALRESGEPS